MPLPPGSRSGPRQLFAIVLLALLMGTPSTVKDASVPVAPLVKVRPLLPVFTVKSLAAPDVLLTIARRAPLESFTTLAVTPMFALVIAAANPSRVLLVASIVMVAAGWLPTWTVNVPAASGVVLFATAPE